MARAQPVAGFHDAQIYITELSPRSNHRGIEIVERKGLGHPDTICDALAETVSRSLTRYYIEHFGRPLHHNLDKVLLRAGSSEPEFAGGRIKSPITVYLCGRATMQYHHTLIDVASLTQNAAYEWFEKTMPGLVADGNLVVQSLIRPGAKELIQLFEQRIYPIALANDTSIGVGFAPLSELETLVLDLDQELLRQHALHAEIGLDTKLLALRIGDSCDITVACAFVSKHILNIDDYAHKKQRLAEQVLARSQAVFAKSTLLINNADDIKQELIYMTVSGTSAEAGDDGETGRGNRTNGLITPYRPMSIEAAAGKNSYSHTGKIYQIAASHIARSMVKELSGVSDCECFLLSCIGKPVTEPKIVHLRFCAAEGENWDITHPQWLLAHEIIDDQLRKIPELWTEIISDRITIY